MRSRRCVLAVLATALFACGEHGDGGLADGRAVPDGRRADASVVIEDGPVVDGATDAPIVDGAPDASVIDGPPDGPLPDAGPPPDPATACARILPTGNVLLDGGISSVKHLQRGGDRVLAVAHPSDRWLLFDVVTRSVVAGGDLFPGTYSEPNYVFDVVGETILLQVGPSIELRNRSTGALLASVVTDALPGRVGLSIDGSYAWAKTNTQLRAWSRTGQLLVQRDGNYAAAEVIGAPGELRVGNGPGGAEVIETVATATNTSTTSPPFIDEFRAWFADGERFITGSGAVLRVYSKSAVELQVLQLPTYQTSIPFGYGDHVGVRAGGPMYIYRLGQPAPALTITTAIVRRSGRVLALGGVMNLDVVDLGSPTLATTRHPLPGRVYQFDAESPAAWTVGIGYGLVYDNDNLAHPDGPRPLNCGRLFGVAGSATGRVAIATEAGQILYVDVAGGTRTLAAVLPRASQAVQLSADGAVLAAQNATHDEIAIHAMPSGQLIHAFPGSDLHTTSDTFFSLARGGTRIGRGRMGFAQDPPFSRVTNLTGTVTYLNTANDRDPVIVLSPSGVRAAINGLETDPTVIYDGPVLVGTATEKAMGWIDETRLLVAEFGAPDKVATATRILSPSGTVLTTLSQTIPFGPYTPPRFLMMTPTTIYVPETARIYSLVDGSVVWTSAYAPQYSALYPTASVAAGHVVRVVPPFVTIETP